MIFFAIIKVSYKGESEVSSMNSVLLKGKIRAKGVTQGEIATKIGLSLSRFNAKLNNTSGAEFSLGEVRALKTVLSLDSDEVESIFFNDFVS